MARPSSAILSNGLAPGTVRAHGLSKDYAMPGHRPYAALDDVSLEVAPGEALAVLGRNGSGKSTLLQIVAGTLAPTRGSVEVSGRVGALLELGSGVNPELSGRENARLTAAVAGRGPAAIAEFVDEVADFAEIGEFMNQAVRVYSSGMLMRLGFAMYACLRPDIFVIDEALGVGDLAFQRKCIRHLRLRMAEGVSVLVASHDTQLVRRVCSRGIVLEHGRVVAAADISAAVDRYLVGGSAVAPVTAAGAQVGDLPIEPALLRVTIENAAGREVRSVEQQQHVRIRSRSPRSTPGAARV